MKICISETSYLFELAKEIEQKYFNGKTTRRTFFPTLFQESKLGYDALFQRKGKPLFIQTKIPDHISRKGAKEWDYFKKPYFRFNVYPQCKSNQHNLLVDLGRRFKYSVFYVGPLFFTNREFNSVVLKKQVIIQSQFICTESLQKNKGNDKHVICYSKGIPPIMQSETKVVENSFDGNDFVGRLKMIPEITFQSFLSSLNGSIWDFISKHENEGRSVFDILLSIGIFPVFLETDYSSF